MAKDTPTSTPLSGEGRMTIQAAGPAVLAARLVGRPGDFHHLGNQILGSAVQMTSRLRDHIERLDNGAVHAADDLAVVLRALLCPGTGNSVLRRLYQECGVSEPVVIVSRAPDANANTQFSVGSIPTREEGAIADGGVRVPLKRWANLPVLVVTLAGDQRKFTWADFLNSYANKWGGAHLDAIVPQHLQFIDYYAAGGFSLTNYLLRTAAVEVWLLAQEVYRKIFHNELLDSLKPEERDKISVSAQGGVSTNPPDISNRGQLQWFYHGSDRLGLLWYVDEKSSENALHLALGKVSYDVRYTPSTEQAPGQRVPVAFQAPRHRAEQPISVKPGELKSLTLDGQIKTFSQVRGAASSAKNEQKI